MESIAGRTVLSTRSNRAVSLRVMGWIGWFLTIAHFIRIDFALTNHCVVDLLAMIFPYDLPLILIIIWMLIRTPSKRSELFHRVGLIMAIATFGLLWLAVWILDIQLLF